jgi:hypothetical protein
MDSNQLQQLFAAGGAAGGLNMSQLGFPGSAAGAGNSSGAGGGQGSDPRLAAAMASLNHQSELLMAGQQQQQQQIGNNNAGPNPINNGAGAPGTSGAEGGQA